MPELDPKILELEARLESLVRTQIDFQVEISAMRKELTRLRGAAIPPQSSPKTADRPPIPPQQKPIPQPTPVTQKLHPEIELPLFASSTARSESNDPTPSSNIFSDHFNKYSENARANLEEFIGKNLISKIGILILIIGVGIGAKYAIDNNLISPLTRIIIGYIFGFGLLALAVRLKSKYHNFSAVLLSGGMAIMYFITYFAYSMYQLIAQPAAFVVMVLLTVFTVAFALLYNRQVIAHIGLIGAYAVPFLLSNNSGKYGFLFTYMSVINVGILAISIKKYWKPIFYSSSFFTWLIFYVWYIGKYSASEHFYLALSFLGIFFAIFYATKVVHGVVHSENSHLDSLVSILVTGFIFYCFCFGIICNKAGLAEYVFAFSYLAVAGLAILLASYRFYGRFLVYLAYPFTWLIFGNWFLNYHDVNQHFAIAAVFASVFFAVYYGATLVYRLITDELNMIENAGLVLSNSFIFYGFGYAILNSREDLRGFEGLFTVAHSAFHSLVSQFVSRVKPFAVDVIQVLVILILTFVTIAVPVQFDGSFVTLIWSVLAAMLFIFGRHRKIELFEYFSYPVMLLAAISMFADWSTSYAARTPNVSEYNLQPILNGDLITALVLVASFAAIFAFNRDKQYEPPIDRNIAKLIGYVVAGIAIFVFYNAFRIEIDNYFHIRNVATINKNFPTLNISWQIIYTMLFLSGMAAVNLRKARSKILAFAGSGLSLATLFCFVTVGMVLMHELRVSYLTSETAGLINVGIRYISYFAAGALLFSLFVYSRNDMLTKRFEPRILKLAFEGVFTSTLFIAASCELVNLMAQFHIADGTKLGLSILWGVFALGMVVIGIAQDKKYLRIAAFVLLAVTLVKLFFYDITGLGTIPKTILFISLGILLLIVSFLYNKYKHVMFKTIDENTH